MTLSALEVGMLNNVIDSAFGSRAPSMAIYGQELAQLAVRDLKKLQTEIDHLLFVDLLLKLDVLDASRQGNEAASPSEFEAERKRLFARCDALKGAFGRFFVVFEAVVMNSSSPVHLPEENYHV